MKLGLKIDKKDLIIIVVLAVIFFSIATTNLGVSQYPSSTATLTPGQSFYINLGAQTHVKSMLFLLNGGAINATISTGSPGNWTTAITVTWPYSNGGWSEDYNKYVPNPSGGVNEIPIDKTTQYLKVDFGVTGSYQTSLSEIAVVDQSSQMVTIQSITNSGVGSPNLHNLVDEQNKVQYPSDYMQNTYFDEIYFVRTAQQYINWQSHVTPYEWTHPPLGKLIQAGGIMIFGFSPFGWRIMGVIFATLMIPLLYLLGKKMFGTWIGGFTAAFLLTFDFMHFTMARMGTADTYVVFFSVASQLFFLIYLKNVLDDGWKTSIKPLFLAVVLGILGVSTKWLDLFGFLGALAILASMRVVEVKNLRGNLTAKFYALLDRPYSQIVAFLLLGIGIYFMTYIPDMLTGRSFLDVLKLQDQMYIYQSTLRATHPFASPWYSWPFLVNPLNGTTHVPLWLALNSLPNAAQSTIVLLGNPAVWWFGFASLMGLTVVTVTKLLKKRFKFSLRDNLPAIFILVIFFFQWLAYLFVSRITFIYHFYVCVPFLCLGSAYVISRYWGNRWAKILAIAYFAVVVGLFVLFYPVISGVPTTSTTVKGLEWFKSWILGST